MGVTRLREKCVLCGGFPIYRLTIKPFTDRYSTRSQVGFRLCRAHGRPFVLEIGEHIDPRSWWLYAELDGDPSRVEVLKKEGRMLLGLDPPE